MSWKKIKQHLKTLFKKLLSLIQNLAHWPNPQPQPKNKALRRWGWLKNIIHLKNTKTKPLFIAENELLALFTQKKDELEQTDLAFSRNKLPLISGKHYIEDKVFNQYLSLLAPNRHYFIFSHMIFLMLKHNAISTLQLLQNLVHINQQLIERNFFQKAYGLLYVKNKSQQWIASLMFRIMPTSPKKIIETQWDVSMNTPFPEGEEYKNLLLCDDICYTGTQLSRTIRGLAQKLAADKKSMLSATLTVVVARMSLFALKQIKETINEITFSVFDERLPKINLVVGQFMFTLSAQLDFLPFKLNQEEKDIIKQLLYADYSEKFKPGDLQRKPLLTTSWKKPDFVSSYYKLLGLTDAYKTDITLISAAFLPETPSAPIRFFSDSNPPPCDSKLQYKNSWISGPKIKPY